MEVHVGGCYAAGMKLKVISREQAQAALVEGGLGVFPLTAGHGARHAVAAARSQPGCMAPTPPIVVHRSGPAGGRRVAVYRAGREEILRLAHSDHDVTEVPPLLGRC